MKYLIIIPARGGSKGIPKKNISNLNGFPLIQYSIESALDVSLKIKNINVIVSTDNDEIKNVACNLGADVPFLRPEILANDTSASIDYILHAIEFFSESDIKIENIIILQPTSPLRTSKDIIEAINLYERKKGASLISVYEEHTLNNKIIYTRGGHYGYPVDEAHNLGQRRQDDEIYLVRNGAIYITHVDYLKTEKKIISDKPIVYVMPKYRSINIDTQDDLLAAEKLLK